MNAAFSSIHASFSTSDMFSAGQKAPEKS